MKVLYAALCIVLIVFSIQSTVSGKKLTINYFHRPSKKGIPWDKTMFICVLVEKIYDMEKCVKAGGVCEQRCEGVILHELKDVCPNGEVCCKYK